MSRGKGTVRERKSKEKGKENGKMECSLDKGSGDDANRLTDNSSCQSMLLL